MTLARSRCQMQLLNPAPSKEITSNAQARNVYGSAMQDVACAALGLHPIGIDGTFETCFDAELGAAFFEIKSVRKNSKIVVYDFRMEKEAASGVEAYYIIVVHNIKGAKSVAEIIENLRQQPPTIIKASLVQIHTRALLEPLRKVELKEGDDPRAGYFREGYREGYRNLPVAPLIADSHLVGNIAVNLYDDVSFKAALRILF